MKKQYDLETRRKYVQIASIIAIILVLGLATIFLLPAFLNLNKDPDALKNLFAGVEGRFIYLGLQLLQIFVALLPGEVIELAAGYSFGIFEGTFLCYLGIFIAATLVFFLVRRFGSRAVDTLVNESLRRKIFRILNSPKRDLIIFILYFIPGTPKDVFNFIVPLTKISYGRYMLISLIARIPSVLSSTLSGSFIEEEQYTVFAVIYGLTAIISLIGGLIYKRFIKKRDKELHLAPLSLNSLQSSAPLTQLSALYRSGELSKASEYIAAMPPYRAELEDALKNETSYPYGEAALLDECEACLLTGEDADGFAEDFIAHTSLVPCAEVCARLLAITGNARWYKRIAHASPNADVCNETACMTYAEGFNLFYLPDGKMNNSGLFSFKKARISYLFTKAGGSLKLTIKSDRRCYYKLGIYIPSEYTTLNGKRVTPDTLIKFEKLHKREESYVLKLS